MKKFLKNILVVLLLVLLVVAAYDAYISDGRFLDALTNSKMQHVRDTAVFVPMATPEPGQAQQSSRGKPKVEK